jgi:hypothetical protein
MPNYAEGSYKNDFLRLELDTEYSREQQTVVAAAALKKGTVLGIKTADGKYYPSIQGATDGTQNACAVLFDDMAIAATGAPATVVVRGAIFQMGGLIWDASYTTLAQKQAACAALRALGMPVVTA